MVRRISAREAQELLEQKLEQGLEPGTGDAGGFDVVDVREPHEWATGHIPGARLVPLAQLRANPEAAHLGARVLFVCEKGGRSLQAAQLAEARGGAEVYSLDGGTSAWRAAGLPVVQPATQQQAAQEGAAPELDAVVGSNVAALRAQRGYTLDVLAGLSGVGRQTLGQIELGRTVPSLGTLWKIARAFDVPFAALLARPAATETRIFRGASAKRIAGTDGRFSTRALFSPDDKHPIEFYELWLAGHGREQAEPHAPGTRENLVVNAGRLIIELGKERHELARGDAIEFTADVTHAYVNPASEECWANLVMTYSSALSP